MTTEVVKEFAICVMVDEDSHCFAKMTKYCGTWGFELVPTYARASKFATKYSAEGTMKSFEEFRLEASRGGLTGFVVDRARGEELDQLDQEDLEEPENILHLAYSEY